MSWKISHKFASAVVTNMKHNLNIKNRNHMLNYTCKQDVFLWGNKKNHINDKRGAEIILGVAWIRARGTLLLFLSPVCFQYLLWKNKKGAGTEITVEPVEGKNAQFGGNSAKHGSPVTSSRRMKISLFFIYGLPLINLQTGRLHLGYKKNHTNGKRGVKITLGVALIRARGTLSSFLSPVRSQ